MWVLLHTFNLLFCNFGLRCYTLAYIRHTQSTREQTLISSPWKFCTYATQLNSTRRPKPKTKIFKIQTKLLRPCACLHGGCAPHASPDGLPAPFPPPHLANTRHAAPWAFVYYVRTRKKLLWGWTGYTPLPAGSLQRHLAWIWKYLFPQFFCQVDTICCTKEKPSSEHGTVNFETLELTDLKENNVSRWL